MPLQRESDCPAQVHHVTAAEAFTLWSQTYDDELNPLLTLEKRFLEHLLPPLSGRDVLDVGCGTGRWLQALTCGKPASLVGVDSSSAMLSHAVSGCGGVGKLMLGEATKLPVPDSSFDLVLASFVVSYIEELKCFASEVARVTRAGACVFVSDLHPETVTRCRWKRAFHFGEATIELGTTTWELKEIISCFEECGFDAIALLEPAFGRPERVLLERAGKLHVYSETADSPAVYILEFVKRAEASSSRRSEMTPAVALTGGKLSLGATEAIAATITFGGGKITSIGECSHTSDERVSAVDLSGYLVIPGLINAHDHLDFGLFPRLGRGPYANFVEWASDIHDNDSATIARFRRLPRAVSVWWGAIHNLLCGVTSVCHHDPLSPEMGRDDFPVRILSRFGWAHSVKMDEQLASKFDCTPEDVPFILHLGEGIGDSSSREVYELDSLHALNERTILVHGLALGEEEMKLVNRRGATLVWCPTSNQFLFGRTHTRASVASAERIVLGSDSPLTASGDLLDEIRFACSEVGIDSREMYQQVTTRSAHVFRLQNGEGTLLPGAVADLIAVRTRIADTPADTLAQLSSSDVELVMLAGRVQLASEEMMSRLPEELVTGLQPIQVDTTVRWVRAPLRGLFEEAEHILGCGLVLGGKRLRNLCMEWL